jgi:hypothetical protein
MIKLIDLLNEYKNVGVLYHFTNIPSLNSIIKDNKLISSSYLSRSIRKKGEENKTISFTRNKDLGFKEDIYLGAGTPNVRIMIDGDKLSNNYKIEPFNFFNFKTKHSPSDLEAEEEERVIFNKDSIKDYIDNFDKYVIYYDIFIDQFINNENINKVVIEKIIDIIDFISRKTSKIRFFYNKKEISYKDLISILKNLDN